MKKILLTAGVLGGAVAVGVKLARKHNLVERGGILATEVAITAQELAGQAVVKVTEFVDTALTKFNDLLVDEEPTEKVVGEPETAPQDFSSTGVGWPAGKSVDDTQDIPAGGRL